MTWHEHLDAGLADVLVDLEQQADGLALERRDAEVAELARAEYAQVDLIARLHASVGDQVVIGLPGVRQDGREPRLEGRLRRVGAGWCLLDDGRSEWLLRVAALVVLEGLAVRGAALEGRPLTARLGLGSALRRVAETRAEAVVHLCDGRLLVGTLARVGADFLDLRSVGEQGAPAVARSTTVPFSALAAVRTG
jgi:hypothetical protein